MLSAVIISCDVLFQGRGIEVSARPLELPKINTGTGPDRQCAQPWKQAIYILSPALAKTDTAINRHAAELVYVRGICACAIALRQLVCFVGGQRRRELFTSLQEGECTTAYGLLILIKFRVVFTVSLNPPVRTIQNKE
jgi:hypothetical protein